jgi:glucoamylase
VERRHENWTLRHPVRRVLRGKILRIILASEASVIWSSDNWTQVNTSETTHESSLNVWHADFPTSKLPAGSRFAFTLFWKNDQRWQGHNWDISII